MGVAYISSKSSGSWPFRTWKLEAHVDGIVVATSTAGPIERNEAALSCLLSEVQSNGHEIDQQSLMLATKGFGPDLDEIVKAFRALSQPTGDLEVVSQANQGQELVSNVSGASSSSRSAAAPELSKYDVFLTHDWRGADGNNHARVQRVHESLSRLGVTSWFDENEIRGDIQARMVEGIERSSGVLVFLTKRYHDKVVDQNDQDNCKFEFDIAMNFKRGSVTVVVMEDEMLDTSNWCGKMRAVAMKLYVSLTQIDNFSDAQLDRYLRTKLVPQMTWIAR